MKKRRITTIILDKEVNIKHIVGITRENGYIDLYNSFMEDKIIR